MPEPRTRRQAAAPTASAAPVVPAFALAALLAITALPVSAGANPGQGETCVASLPADVVPPPHAWSESGQQGTSTWHKQYIVAGHYWLLETLPCDLLAPALACLAGFKAIPPSQGNETVPSPPPTFLDCEQYAALLEDVLYAADGTVRWTSDAGGIPACEFLGGWFPSLPSTCPR